MKIIVMSDSHGNLRSLSHVLDDFHADMYIHLGDGERELNTYCLTHPDKNIYHVSGNCDHMSLSPDELLTSPDDKNVIF
ncbi:MAG: metallophosphoesterase family protein, partial [Oscillospiraceae bacterium]|nr:metallophosphoesterase family protein [Oscillospiraceae bacterium]